MYKILWLCWYFSQKILCIVPFSDKSLPSFSIPSLWKKLNIVSIPKLVDKHSPTNFCPSYILHSWNLQENHFHYIIAENTCATQQEDSNSQLPNTVEQLWEITDQKLQHGATKQIRKCNTDITDQKM